MLLSKCTLCNNKKTKFIKEQEESGLLISLPLKTPLNKIPLLNDLLFWCCFFNAIPLNYSKCNSINVI